MKILFAFAAFVLAITLSSDLHAEGGVDELCYKQCLLVGRSISYCQSQCPETETGGSVNSVATFNDGTSGGYISTPGRRSGGGRKGSGSSTTTYSSGGGSGSGGGSHGGGGGRR